MQLFVHEGITPSIRRAFVIYLASHNRPVHEVLFPPQRDIRQEYERSSRGMTTEQVDLPTLLTARDRMEHELQSGVDANERRFLVSLVSNQPEWALLRIAHLDQMPGIRWKLRNLSNLQTGTAEPRQIRRAGWHSRAATRVGEARAQPTSDRHFSSQIGLNAHQN